VRKSVVPPTETTSGADDGKLGVFAPDPEALS
jgi:hypothetical protein